MTAEYIIHIDPPAIDDQYAVTLQRRDNGAFVSLAKGMLALPTDTVADLQNLLPGAASDKQVFAAGKSLYARLSTAVGQQLGAVLDGAQVCLYLDLPKGELLKVPWEIMVWPASTPTGALACAVTRKHHLSRVYKPDWASTPPQHCGPLRVLILVGAEDDQAVQAELELQQIRRRIQAAQRTIDIEVFVPSEKQLLYDKLKEFRPQVLHFSGHAEYDPPALAFEGWSWTADEVLADVGHDPVGGWKPRLVLLNACRTASGATGSGSMAGAFMMNASAVVAMQGDIDGRAAGILAGVFYERLATDMPVNEALSYARQAIGSAQQVKQAALPALTTLCPPPCVLASFHRLDATYQTRVPQCEFFPRFAVFVNQVKARRVLCDSFWPRQQSNAPRRFVLLRGDPKFGKSLLGAWLLDLSLRMGHHARYVSFSRQSAVSCIKVLDLIWHGEQQAMDSPLNDPLPPLPSELATQLCSSKDPAVYTPFREELLKVSSQRPVTIVIDQIQRKIDPGGFWTLWKNLFIPLARNDLPGVNLVLVLSQEDYAGYDIELELRNRPELRITFTDVVLEGMTDVEFMERFCEYAYFRDPHFREQEYYDDLSRLVTLALRKIPGPHPISLLEGQLKPLAQFLQVALDELR